MSAIRFDGQVAVVTGAGNGLGKCYALELGARGAAVVVNDLGCKVDGSGSSVASADEVVNQIRAAGGRAAASYDSVAESVGAQRIIQCALDNFGRVDALISNAGNLINAPLDELSDEIIDSLLNIHLKGAFNVARPAFRAMKRQGYGRILFASSSAGLFGNPTQAAYGAAKAGIIGLMNVTALEGKPYGIHANALLPAAMTRMSEQMAPEALEKLMVATRGFGNPGVPTFVTPLALYLVSKECTATHGIYSAAGGRIARAFIGITRGWQGSTETAPTVEEIAGHFEQAEDRSHWDEPMDIADEYMFASTNRESSPGLHSS